MHTTHRIEYGDSSLLKSIDDESVDLVVTSPPYPMVSMWDNFFSELDSQIRNLMNEGKNDEAFELMHQKLDSNWKSIFRVLKQGGICCINIGDSTRTFDDVFKMYNSHSRILTSCISIGFSSLPSIIWKKSTNSPNKFMGSGMYPVGSHVTLEHEHILVMRKGERRKFKTKEAKLNRHESAFFWEERNRWFSDTWRGIQGRLQDIDEGDRERSAAFPFKLAYRLINMFSVKNDTVLDPFLGTGTTTRAAICSQRNSIGVELSDSLSGVITDQVMNSKTFCNKYIADRFKNHLEYIDERIKSGKEVKHKLNNHDFPCISYQESKILINNISSIEKKDDLFEVKYEKLID